MLVNIDFTPLVQAILEIVLGLVISVITAKLIPWIKSKLNESQLEAAKKFIKLAVKAAEQLFNQDECEAKFDYVFNTVENWFISKGINFEEGTIETMIESAVLDLKTEINNKK